MSQHSAAPPEVEVKNHEPAQSMEENYKQLPDPKNKKEREQIEQCLIKLRQDGYATEEIAKLTGYSVKSIRYLAHQLILAGRTVPLRRGTKSSSGFWHNLEDERTQTITKMVQQRATNKEIGVAFGYTREWARLVINDMREEHGETIFVSDNSTWTPGEAADELEVASHIIIDLCRSGEIPATRRGESSYLISEESMRLLRVHPRVIRKEHCLICERMFTLDERKHKRVVCSSKKCLAGYHRQRRAAFLARGITFASLKGWRREVWQKLQTHHLPQKEQWLPFVAALQKSGLSQMQLSHLRECKIITTRPHPVKKARTGRPAALYAASEMKIIRKVFRKYTNCTKRW